MVRCTTTVEIGITADQKNQKKWLSIIPISFCVLPGTTLAPIMVQSNTCIGSCHFAAALPLGSPSRRTAPTLVPGGRAFLQHGDSGRAASSGQVNVPPAARVHTKKGAHMDALQSSGGEARIRTGGKGFAGLCLTTWPLRRYAKGRKRNRPSSKQWSGQRGSNPRPQPWQGCALPTEPCPLARK